MHLSAASMAVAGPGDSPVVARAFTFCLLATTVSMFLLMPALASQHWPFGDGMHALAYLGPVFGAHQVATLYLFTDREARAVVAADRAFFLVWPLVIVAATTVWFYFAGVTALGYFWAFFAGITIYHYQKQNIGVFALLAPVLGHGRMSTFERRLILAGGLIGIAAFAYPIDHTPFHDTVLGPAHDWIVSADLIAFAALMAVAVWHVVRQLRAREAGTRPEWLKYVLLLVLVGYYWPLFVIENRLVAFLMFAGSHALQYFAIMGFVAANGTGVDGVRAAGRRGLWQGAVSVVLLGAISYLAWQLWDGTAGLHRAKVFEQPWTSALIGLTTSFSLVHYHLDARFWQMRRRESGHFVRSRLPFLFASGRPRTSGA
ncbi:MAG: hypothetical protein KDG50_03590 [Chromatiales bacterium]|nr:hypothetical protein [Chromatiales bacterium]